jgi:hypothetical protein
MYDYIVLYQEYDEAEWEHSNVFDTKLDAISFAQEFEKSLIFYRSRHDKIPNKKEKKKS